MASIVANVIHQHRLDGFTARELAFAILDKVEPKIREDERRQIRLDGESPSSEWHLEYLQDQADTLRAQVEALDDLALLSGTYVLRSDVLALFDGREK